MTEPARSDPLRSSPDEITRKFLFRFTSPYRMAGLPFGVVPGTCGVVLSQGRLTAAFGPWRVRTELSNVASTELSGPFGMLLTAGPARLSFSDRGLTFATNPDQAVCIKFHRSVSGIEPAGLLRHPGLTVTVADCAGLMAALEDARREGISA